MLIELRIKNFVLIEDLSMNFTTGLNILSGETGAGKSILIGALSGILGEKMTTDMIRTGFEKATLEGVFDIANLPQVAAILDDAGIDFEDEQLILRRELYSSGKGRCFANSIQIPIARLKELSEYLVDIHGQNEHQNITKTSKHRELLDSFGNLHQDVKSIKEIHEKLNTIKNKLESLKIDEREKARILEFNKFAINEIESANLLPGEEEELKNEETLLANAEKLFKEVNNASRMMNGDGSIIQKLKSVEQSLARVSEYDTDISGTFDTIKEAMYALEDAAVFLRDYEKNIDFSPHRINQVEERLSLLSSLKKKYGDTTEDILAYAENAGKELDAINSSDEELDRLQNEYKDFIKEAKELAFSLSEKRMQTASTLENNLMKELNDLGMGGTVFRTSIKRELNPEGIIESDNKRYVLYPHGMDRIEFLLSANKGEELRQLKKVASGGEMSRIMLALKNVVLSADIVETLIFDEVDAGISGKTAEIVGKKLKVLSKNRQVLVITHLPQIAAMSDNHFFIQKNETNERITTTVKCLNEKEKIKEIARMLAGEQITDLSLKHAEEMVKMSVAT